MANVAVVAAAAFLSGAPSPLRRAAMLDIWSKGELCRESALTSDVAAACLKQGDLADFTGSRAASLGEQPAVSLCGHRTTFQHSVECSCRNRPLRVIGRGSQMGLRQWAARGSNHIKRASPWTMRSTTPSFSAVKRILVCGDPMCEESGAAEVLKSLRDHQGILCRVDDTGCLGCCGEGPQVCLEYDGGGAQIVCGTAA
eukprot:6208880-Pleurochrysis_carterae.AAC.2